MKKVRYLFLFFLLTLLLAGCSNNTNTNIGNTTGDNTTTNDNADSSNNKTTPVYQGMVLSKDNPYTNLSYSNLRYSNDSINQDDPFNNGDNAIENAIADEITVENSESLDYYANLNEDLYLTIKVANPDSFEILSFTLNGTKYQSYQFQEGSDSENLVLKVNSRNVSGIKEFTIDQIKYVDGTDIKDVIIDGNQTIQVGVKYSNEPTAEITDLSVRATSFSLKVNISDEEALIDKSGNILKAVLFDGKNIIQTHDLIVGNNDILFDKLTVNTLYQYAIVSVYNNMDGNGDSIKILNKEALYTTGIIDITNVVPTQDSISFDINVTDEDEVGSISAIELYKGDELVESLTDLTLREFTGLLSNNEYTIKVTYTYDLNDGLGDRFSYSYPSNTILTGLHESDINILSVLSNTDLQIGKYYYGQVKDFGVVNQGTTDEMKFLNFDNGIKIYSNNQSEVQIGDFVRFIHGATMDGVYDGINSVTQLTVLNNQHTQLTSTLAKATPEVVVRNVISTQNSISFDVNAIDEDAVGTITAIELYKGDELINSLTDLTLREFDGLLSNNEYTIKVKYSYDLNDGIGEQEEVVTYDVTTEEKATPEVVVVNVVPTQDSISFDINVTDEDAVETITAIELYKGDELINSLTDLTLRKFDGLFSLEEYTIKVTYTFDLSDGFGENRIIVDKKISTQLFDGLGTVENPYKIKDANDLNNLDVLDNSDLYYELVNDIDLNDVEVSISDFYGHLNGNGFIIKNYNIDKLERVLEDESIGLININYGKLSNVKINDYNILFENTGPGILKIGVLTGENKGTVVNCNTNGIINVTSSQNITIGGLIGYNLGVLENSYSNGEISGLSHLSINSGGLVGVNNDGSITNSYSNINQNITSDSEYFMNVRVGGIAGSNVNSSVVSNAYSTGIIIVESNNNYGYVGGIIGENSVSDVMNVFTTTTINVAGTESINFANKLVGQDNYGLYDNIYVVDVINVELNNQKINTSNIEVNIINQENLNNKEWYTNTLGLEESIWDFSNINDDTIYPRLIEYNNML